MVTRKDDLITIELPQNGYKVYSQDLFVTQWNKGQKLAILGITDGTEVQFGNEIVETTLNRRVENGIVEIPDIMLTYAEPIIAYVQVITANSETTRYEILIRVEERTKPADYIEPEDEQSFRQYMEQIMLETKAIAESKQDKLNAGIGIVIDEETNTISATSGSGGTSNYNDLEEKPQINDVELVGELSLDDLGIQPKGDYALVSDIPTDYVPNTRKVAGKELKEDVTSEDIINSFYDNSGNTPLTSLEILLSKSYQLRVKANKSEALKSVQIALNSNSVRLEYVDGSTSYGTVAGLTDLLKQIEEKAEKSYLEDNYPTTDEMNTAIETATADLREVMPTVLDAIEIEEECVGALTFANILDYFNEYKQLKIFGFMPYTETNTSAGNITIAGHGNSDFNMSASYYYFQKSGLQTSTRLKRLYFEITPLWTSEAGTVYYDASGIISESTAYSPYTNTYKNGTYPNNGMIIGGSIIPLRRLSIYQAQTWAVGTKFYLLGVK